MSSILDDVSKMLQEIAEENSITMEEMMTPLPIEAIEEDEDFSSTEAPERCILVSNASNTVLINTIAGIANYYSTKNPKETISYNLALQSEEDNISEWIMSKHHVILSIPLLKTLMRIEELSNCKIQIKVKDIIYDLTSPEIITSLLCF